MMKFPSQLSIKHSSLGNKEESVTCLGLLRAIPGKRYVYDALWNDRAVIVKVFSDKISANRHLKREWHRLNLLEERSLSAPVPLFFGKTGTGDLAMVVEKIVDSSVALDVFNEMESPTARLNLLGLISEELAKQHSKGVLQKDMHLGNFLLQKEKVFALDPAQMSFSRKVSKKKIIAQLAVLASFLSEENVEEITSLCKQYAAVRSWKFSSADMTLFWKKQAAYRKYIINKSLKKRLRTNKREVKTVKCDHHAVASRDFFEKMDFAQFVQNIDQIMTDGQILKDGNTCFVSRVKIADKDIVIKRYNCKGLVHSIRHTLKRSRARRNWLHAHRLEMLNIPTAKPLAFIEKRRPLIVYKSYFITEYIDGQGLDIFLADSTLSDQERLSMDKKITELLNKLDNHRITHGDLKHSNILIANNKPTLIDLDSMMVHKFDFLLKNKRQKDRANFENYV